MKISMFLMSGALFAGIGVAVSPVEAKIKRHCQASYRYFFTSIQDSVKKKVRFTGKPFAVVTGVQGKYMRAAGRCGSTVPNRCRGRAAKSLRDCGRAYHKSPDGPPRECRGIRNVPRRLNTAIRNAVCATLKTKILPKIDYRRKRRLTVRVRPELLLRGRKGCSVKGARRMEFQSIRVFCR